MFQQVPWVHSASFDSGTCPPLNCHCSGVQYGCMEWPGLFLKLVGELASVCGNPCGGSGERAEAQEGACGQRPSKLLALSSPAAAPGAFPGACCARGRAHCVQLRRRTPVAAWGGGGWRAVSSTEADRVPARAGSQALTGTSVAVNAGHAGLPWCPSWAYSGPSGQGHPARTGQLARCAEVRETPPLPLRLSGWRLGPWSGDGGATRWRGAGPPDTCGPRQGPFPWPPGLCPRPPKRTRQVSEGALAAEPRWLPPCPLGGSKRGGPLERQSASPGLPGLPSGHGRPCRWGALEGPRFGTGRPGLAGLAGLARQRSASRLPAAHLQCPLVRSLCWGGSRRIEGAEMR